MAFIYLDFHAILNSLNPTYLEMVSNQSALVSEKLLALDIQVIYALAIDPQGSIIFDMGYNAEDISSFEELGFTLQGTDAIDPDFLTHIPAAASFVFHGTDLKTTYDFYETTDQANRQLFNLETSDFMQQVAQIESVFQTLGLDFKQDFLSWQTGDYAVFFTYIPPDSPSVFAAPFYPGQRFETGLEFGAVFEITDAAKAQAMIEKLTIPPVIDRYAIIVGREEIAGANAVTASIVAPELSSSLKLVIAANDDIFVVGTRNAVTAILNGQGGFNTTPAFLSAEPNLLESPTMMLYGDSNSVNLAGDMMAVFSAMMSQIFINIVMEFEDENITVEPPVLADQQAMIEQMQRQARITASYFSALTFSSTSTQEGDMLIRFTIRLAEGESP